MQCLHDLELKSFKCSLEFFRYSNASGHTEKTYVNMTDTGEWVHRLYKEIDEPDIDICHAQCTFDNYRYLTSFAFIVRKTI